MRKLVFLTFVITHLIFFDSTCSTTKYQDGYSKLIILIIDNNDIEKEVSDRVCDTISKQVFDYVYDNKLDSISNSKKIDLLFVLSNYQKSAFLKYRSIVINQLINKSLPNRNMDFIIPILFTNQPISNTLKANILRPFATISLTKEHTAYFTKMRAILNSYLDGSLTSSQAEWKASTFSNIVLLNSDFKNRIKNCYGKEVPFLGKPNLR
jgi:hypothetical protein